MMKHWLGLLYLVTVSSIVLANEAFNSLNINLTGGDASTFELNLLETVSAYNESLYLPTLLKLFGDDDEFDTDSFELKEEMYQELLDSLDFSEFDQANIQFDVKYSIHTPRIQAHYDYYKAIEKDLNLLEMKDSFGNPISNQGKVDNWVLYNEQIYGSVDDLYAMKTDSRSTAVTTEFDRVIGEKGPLLIFYGNHLSEDFPLFFKNLYESARIGKLRFVWRYIPSFPGKSDTLTGYGVDLTLKNSKLVVDDDEEIDHPKLDVLQDMNKIDQTKTIYPLKRQALNDLGAKLSAMTISKHFKNGLEKLRFLKKILNDFPKFASFIADSDIDINYVKPYVLNNQNIGLAKESYGIYINGSPIHKLQLDYLKLIKKIRDEAAIVLSLEKFGFNHGQAKYLLEKFAMISAYKQSQFRTGNTIMGKNENRFRLYDFNFLDNKQHGVVFLNDIKKDETYSEYTTNPDQAYELNLQANQIPPLRENVHDIVFAINMTDKAQLRVFFALTKIILDNGIPQQVGILPIAETDRDKFIAKAFYHIVESTTQQEALAFLYKYLESKDEEESQELFTKVNLVNYEFDESIYRETLTRFDITQASVIVNGVMLDLSAPDWQISMSKQIAQDIKILKQYLKSEKSSRKPLKEALYTNAKTKRVTRIIPTDPVDAIYKPIDQELIDSSILFRKSSGLKGTYWLFGDLNTKNVREQLINLLDTMKSSDYQVRLLNTGETPKLIKQINSFELNKLSNYKLDSIVEILKSPIKAAGGMNQTVVELLEKKKLPVNHNFVLYNSRYVRVDSPLENEDIQTLLEYEDNQRLSIVGDLLNAYNEKFDRKSIEDFMKYDATKYDIFTSIITKSFHTDDKLFISDVARFDFEQVDLSTSFDIGTGGVVDVLVILDPIDENSQHMVSMIDIIKDIPYLNVKILMHPKLEAEDLNIKRFYRGSNDEHQTVGFTNIPSEELYTMELITPNNWITVPLSTSDVDFENLKIENYATYQATYELKYLLIEASIKDVAIGIAPSGASFELENGDLHTESSMMSAMGYLQLHSKPGTSKLYLEEKTNRYYNLLSANENKYAANNQPVDSSIVNIFDLYGKTIYPRLKKKPVDKSILDDFSETKDHEDVNIFAVASGHMYERFLGSMFLSVRKTTKGTIKFWILETYLSQQFKKTLPELAREYNFKYELISYKWPNFLRTQRDKQRSIWGYKILFLDLIFPRSLDRVIFIDADQLVQSDITELVNIDMEGAPYGFVPMCDDREDMEGYRFWKTGYWAKILGEDLKYHISALFVVDLNRFRQLKVGERLRSHYQKLSLDSNSLSNLDQDLPNNLQRMIPIYSLPQHWLWCETWCSQKTKKDAKSIDLCNDPLTKEQKLDRAKRILPQWEEYDYEYRKVKEHVQEQIELVESISDDPSIEEQTGSEDIEHDEL